MSKDKVSNWSSYFDVPNPGLRTYFDRVVKGNSDIYRTTFYRGKSTSQVLKEWEKILYPKLQHYPGLKDFEKDLASKVGPMSVMKPLEERMDDIDSYYDSISLESIPIEHSALAAVLREWGKVRGMSLRSQKNVISNMKLSTNSGNPFFTKRRLVVNKTYPVTVGYTDANIYQRLVNEEWLSTAVLGWRGQEGGPTPDDVKQRVVWMFPLGINIAEQQVYQPCIERVQSLDIVPAWVGLDSVERHMTMLMNTKGKGDLIVCTDFTKFDQHFNPSLQAAAKFLIQGLLDNTAQSKDWLENVFPVKYSIPLAYNYGYIRKGLHGMASGSGGTNFDETLVHRALQFESAIHAKQRLNINSMCLGDDGCLSYPHISAEQVMQSYTAHGLDMNLSKQSESTHEAIYLRRWYDTDYRNDEGICMGVYATTRAIGRLCEQERYFDPEVWGPKMVALRQLSIIENCNHHPLWESFVTFCMKGDKYRLGLDIPGFLDNIAEEAKLATDLMPEFLGYTRTLAKANPAAGISNWRIVQYLRNFK